MHLIKRLLSSWERTCNLILIMALPDIVMVGHKAALLAQGNLLLAQASAGAYRVRQRATRRACLWASATTSMRSCLPPCLPPYQPTPPLEAASALLQVGCGCVFICCWDAFSSRHCLPSLPTQQKLVRLARSFCIETRGMRVCGCIAQRKCFPGLSCPITCRLLMRMTFMCMYHRAAHSYAVRTEALIGVLCAQGAYHTCMA